MNQIVIKIKDAIESSKAIDSSSGEKLNNVITQHFKEGNIVVLDFEGINSILSLFLNPAIGDLYGEFSEEKIRESLSFINFPQAYAETLKRVVERAKAFYNDKEKVSKIIDKETMSDDESDKKN